MPSTSRSSDLDSKDFSQTFPAVLLRPVGTADTAGDCEKTGAGGMFGKINDFGERLGPERSRCRQLQPLSWNQVSPTPGAEQRG